MVKIARKSNNRYDSDGRRRVTVLPKKLFWLGIAGIVLIIAVVSFSFREMGEIDKVLVTTKSNEGETAVGSAAVAAAAAAAAAVPKDGSPPPPSSGGVSVSHRTPLAYGTKSGKDKTGELVKQAIGAGFRHIVTGGHHEGHNESGVGIGWKHSGMPRTELFLQTCFVPFTSPNDFQRQPSDPEELPKSIEDQVHLSIQTSLANLQTSYIDAMVFHNFRAKLWNYDELIKAWRVFEEYVDKGVIRQLGITSVHDPVWFEKFYNETTIKPTIVQNRFHSNRQYDVPMQEIFDKYSSMIQVQRFWLLNGSSGGGGKNKDMAKAKGVTPAQLMLGFVMSLGSETCLVGTKSLQHMKDDIEIMKCYPSLFDTMDTTDAERNEYATKLGMKQPSNRPLPGHRRRGGDSGGAAGSAIDKMSRRTCQSSTQ